MRKLAIATALALGLVATPALAQTATNSNFTGIRAEVSAGVDDLTRSVRSSDINYGAAVGIDAPLGDRFTVGVEANLDNVLEHEDFGIAGRLGFALDRNLLAYGTVGYTSFRNLDGLRVGAGAELRLGGPFYTKAEYRYSDFQNGIGRHSGLLGVGVRF